jgi:hypothetical protein
MGTPNSLGTLLDNVSVDCQGEPDDTCESYEVLYARVKFSKISNGGDINGWRNWGPGADMAPKVFVGGSAPANEYDDEEWFPLTNPDGSFINDADISGYSDVPGVAVERMEGKIRLVLYGFHTTENYEYGGKELAAGVIEIGSQTTWQAGLQSPLDWSNLNTNTRTHDPLINDASNPMDSRGSFVGYINQFNERFDRVRTFAPDKFQFHLVATTGSDGFYSSYEEPELDCLEGEIDPQ